MAPTTKRTGGCLCGAVRYVVDGSMRQVIYCHCEQCRKTSGHFVAASACAKSDLTLTESRGLTWYKSSSYAERGFCNLCGGNLFWQPVDDARVYVMAGTIDNPTGLQAIAHIYTDSASDYHELKDGLLQYADGGPDNIGSAAQ